MPLKRSEIRRARRTPLKPVLEDLGYQLDPIRNGNYLVRHLVAEIVIKDHFWICRDHDLADNVRKTAGNAIDFLVEVQSMSFSDAVRLLLSYDGSDDTTAVERHVPENHSAGQCRHKKMNRV